MRKIEHHPRPLLEHVEVEAGVGEQRHALLHRLALGVGLGELGIGDTDLLVQLHPRDDAAIALHRVIDEVARQASTQHWPGYLGESTLDVAAEVHGKSESQSDS